MTPRRVLPRVMALASVTGILLLWPAASADAHPLGNFTINHYNGLKLTPTKVVDHAVIDTAEIPTVSAERQVDADGDGQPSGSERAAYALQQCGQLARSLVLRVDGETVQWRAQRTSFAYGSGQAGLRVGRLECELVAAVDLTAPATVTFADDYLDHRIGWREITATGAGVDLGRRDVGTVTISDELRSYPNDLLASPLDQRFVELQVRPGQDSGAGVTPTVQNAGPVTSMLEGLSTQLDDLVGSEEITWGVGLAAVALALILGASHAALPGHGKTLMAAYMVGTRGRPRDAVVIAGTVTLAHTSGVLVLGLLFSAGASLAGERVLAVLGVVSGLLVTGIGVLLVRGALRRRHQQVDDVWGHGHRSPPDGHTHGHDHRHGPGHAHRHNHDHHHDHHHGYHHDHPQAAHDGTGVMVLAADETNTRAPEPDADRGFRRLTLIGMGLAGGLVPSPSALIVLLGAIALGRTAFGIALVLGYGLGMATTLTTVGFLVARLPYRMDRLRARVAGTRLNQLVAASPVVTALIVLLVGLALAARSAAPLI